MRYNQFKYFLILFLLLNIKGYSQINFLPYQIIPLPNAEVVCVKDINDDGLCDVIVGSGLAFRIFIFYQNNQGGLNNFIEYIYPTSGSGIKTIDVDDVNNDNLKDIVIGYGDFIGIFFQNTNGTFDPIDIYYSGDDVYSLKIGDLNNDSLNDIVVGHWNELNIKVFYQTTSGFSSLTYPKLSSGYDEIDIADINNDGKKDVIFLAGQGYAGIYIYLQNNIGTLDNYVTYNAPLGAFNTMKGIAMGDLNNDGRIDLVASQGGNQPDAYITIWYQDTITGQLQTPPIQIPAYDIPEPIEIADLNCDGKNEIITAHGGWLKFSVFEQKNNIYSDYSSFALPYSSHYKPQGLSIGDINNDGKNDVTIVDNNSGLILLINNSKPEIFFQIDTLVYIDTIFSNIFVDSSFFTEIYYDTISNYAYSTIQTFSIVKVYKEEYYSIDSTWIRHAYFCNNYYVDTITTNSGAYNYYLSYLDTVHIFTKIDSVNIVSEIIIYPIPTDEIVNIELPYPFDYNTKLIMIDQLGKIVFRQIYYNSANFRQLNISAFANGIYYLIISPQNSTVEEIKKIVIHNNINK